MGTPSLHHWSVNCRLLPSFFPARSASSTNHQLVTASGVVARKSNGPTPEIFGRRTITRNLLRPEVQYLEKFKGKIKILSTDNLCSWKFTAVCRKIATSCSATTTPPEKEKRYQLPQSQSNPVTTIRISELHLKALQAQMTISHTSLLSLTLVHSLFVC